VFGGDTVFRDGAVVLFVSPVQRMLFAAFFRHRGFSMQFLQAHVAGVGHGFGVGMEPDGGLLEQPEIMAAARSVGDADDSVRRLVDNELCLQGVALFLARVVAALFFLGRSTGVSVASMRTTSYVRSRRTRAFLPGSVKAPLLISVSSHQRMLRYAVRSLPP
jgi:hypothetical protein